MPARPPVQLVDVGPDVLAVVELPGGPTPLPASLSEAERAVLRLHYQTKFGWSPDYGLDYVAPRPRPSAPEAVMAHVAPENGRLSCMAWWWLCSIPAFSALPRLLRLHIRDEWTWEAQAHFALCEVAG